MNKITPNVVVGTMLLLALGAVAGHLLGEPFLKLITPGPVVIVEPSPQEVGARLSGSFLMSMRPLEQENARAGVYRVPAGGGAPVLEDESNDFYAPSLSHDGARVAVVADVGGAPSQLVVSTLTNKNAAEVMSPPAPALFAGASSWSHDDAFLVYEAIAALPSEHDADIAHAHVAVLDTATFEQVLIDEGTSPQYARDGSILYVKRDGVYRVVMNGLDVVGEPERLIYFDGYDATRDTRIALSPDESTLVVAQPAQSLLTAHTIRNVDGAILVSAGETLSRTAFWPVFSPDGAHVAYILTDSVSEGSRFKGIVVIDVASREEHIAYDLTTTDDLYTSLTGWIK